MRRLDTKMDRLAQDVRELKMRTTSVEPQIAGVSATIASHIRMERIEHRLELTER